MSMSIFLRKAKPRWKGGVNSVQSCSKPEYLPDRKVFWSKPLLVMTACCLRNTRQDRYLEVVEAEALAGLRLDFVHLAKTVLYNVGGPDLFV